MTTKDEALSSAALITTTGSRAYGLNHANSDVDQMGVFIAPTLEVAGLNWNQHKESWTNTSPEGDDLTMHEIGKFLRLTLKGNPTLIELYFIPDYILITPVGEELRKLAPEVISESTLRPSYYGYAISQYKRVEALDDYKPKMARHTLRIARQGVELLTTGTTSVRVADPKEYFDLTEMPKEGMLYILKSEIDELRTCESVLNDKPNIDACADFLRSVRKTHL